MNNGINLRPWDNWQKRSFFPALALFWALTFNPAPAGALAGGSLGAVATQHPLATQAASRILQGGGNAIDAAVTAALTLAVVEPYHSGLGGGGLALFWQGPKKKARAVDFRERAPLAATGGMYLGVSPQASRIGPLAIGVPGEILGLFTLHRRWGKLPWKDLFTDPIHLAENGFLPDGTLLARAKNHRDCLQRDYHSAKIFGALWKETPGPPAPWRQPELAQTLKRLAKEGPEVFYQGSLGRSLVSDLQGKGALLTEQDLKQYSVAERKALKGKFTWGKLWGFPLPSSGGISVLRGLNTLEALAKKTDAPPAWIPWTVKVLGQIFAARNSEMGDPDFNPQLPVKKWTGKKFARKNAEEILHPLKEPKTTGETTHLSILDSDGNAVAMTLTLNLSFGSCVTAGETGILMNNQMDDFTTRPGRPNAFGLRQGKANTVAAGKRPLSSMAPTVVTRKGRAILALGSPGGPRIISTLLEVLYRRFFLGEGLKEAIAAPRFHYQGIPRRIYLESGGRAELEPQLGQLRIPLSVGSPWGNVQAAAFDPETGKYQAFSDPRGQGKAQTVNSVGTTGE